MPSPFPGMDPYLESQPFWSNLHSSMIVHAQAELKKRLPRKYSVWSDIYIWLHEPTAETRRGKPDDLITGSGLEVTNGGVATLTAPTMTVLPAVRREEKKYLKIKEVRSDQVITIIEFLSPINKSRGAGHDAYLLKRNEYLATRTNIVEIDLHRTGQRMPMGKPRPPRADYYVLVSQAVDFPKTGIWPFSVRDALPEIPVPLKPKDGFVTLPLQACFDAAYDQGPYDTEVDYSRPPRKRLHGEDAAWAEQLLRKFGRTA